MTGHQRDLLLRLTKRLIIGSVSIGGKAPANEPVPGSIQVSTHDTIF